jgi:multidrug efflux system membrane fusion protein
MNSQASRGRYAVPALVGLGLAIALASCAPAPSSQKPAARAVSVDAVKAEAKPVPVELNAIGHAVAVQSVTVKPQVSGQLQQVFFREGQEVRKGDALFEIDPRPYQEALNKSEAVLAKDKALAEQAVSDEQKYAELLKKNFVSQEQYDQYRANAASLRNQVKADEAQVANDRLQLEYCTIASPIGGRTGNLMVDAGNIVQAGSTALVTINQIAPIEVSFSLPEQNLPDIQKYSAAGTLKAEAIIPQDEQRPIEGSLSFIDNQVDSSTGTFILKARFPNLERRLWPGQYVNVVLTITVQRQATVIPSQAVQAGQNGQFVFVVKPDQTVETRPVTVAGTVGEEVAIAKGIQPGETVVTDGQLLLTPGATVQIKGAAK